jgi:hypothetical protein
MAVESTVTDLLAPRSRARQTHRAASRRRARDASRDTTAEEDEASADLRLTAAAAAPSSKCSALRAVVAAVSLRASRRMPAWAAMVWGRAVQTAKKSMCVGGRTPVSCFGWGRSKENGTQQSQAPRSLLRPVEGPRPCVHAQPPTFPQGEMLNRPAGRRGWGAVGPVGLCAPTTNTEQ